MTTRWRSASFLGRLTNTTRDDLSALGVLRGFPAGQTIIRQGAEDDYALLLLSGSVKITYIDESGYEALLAIRVDGDLIGEMAPLQGQPRSATATTCSELQVRMLTRGELTRFLETHPDAALETAKMVMSRLRWANRRRIDFGACPGPVLAARVLVELVRIYGRSGAQGWEHGVPMAQRELASLAGVGLNTMEKALGELQRRDLVVRQRRRVLVTNMRRLCEFSGFLPENP